MNNFKKIILTALLGCSVGSTTLAMTSPTESKNVETSLHWAAENCTVQVVQCLIEPITPEKRFEVIATKNIFGNTAMHLAVKRDNFQIAQLLINSIDDPKQKNELIAAANNSRYTTLHLAAINNHAPIVQLLLDSIDNPEQRYYLILAKDIFDKTSLDWAVQCMEQAKQRMNLAKHMGLAKQYGNYDTQMKGFEQIAQILFSELKFCEIYFHAGPYFKQSFGSKLVSLKYLKQDFLI